VIALIEQNLEAIAALCRRCKVATNPKGIAAQSPGLLGTSYPGSTSATIINPNGVSAFGFATESLWDSKTPHTEISRRWKGVGKTACTKGFPFVSSPAF